MNEAPRAPEAPPPARSLGMSFAVHAVLLSLLFLFPGLLHLLSSEPPPAPEVEIISSYLATARSFCTAVVPMKRLRRKWLFVCEP